MWDNLGTFVIQIQFVRDTGHTTQVKHNTTQTHDLRNEEIQKC